MSRRNEKKLRRLYVGGIPLIRVMAERMKLKEILSEHIGSQEREEIPAVESLLLLIFNLTLGKEPLYELEDWVASIDNRCIGYGQLENGRFTDDRFGRALDKLYLADRASIMTRVVVTMVKEFNINMDRIHNDSTSVKAFGKIPGSTRTGLELKLGNSKDHRPDLKQLVFSLSISSDGAVPVHHKAYAGNRSDATTHIETWKIIRSITQFPGFLYVADSKLCSDKQLNYIVEQGGRAITIIPNHWTEATSFKEELQKEQKEKKEIWRRRKPGSQDKMEYFSAFEGTCRTNKRGYRIHWIYSSEKRKRDRLSREERSKKAEHKLSELSLKINKRKLKTKKTIRTAAVDILESLKVENLFHIEVGETRERRRVKVGKGRPGKHTKYVIRFNNIYTLSWSRNIEGLKEEARLDGVFPLLCTDAALSAKEVLQAYKYQPNLEKRFNQFKNIHNGAPLLFKKIERVEANIFAFFIALILQALIEREIRRAMKRERIPFLQLYPEQRDSLHPTTSKVLNRFEGISTYKIVRKANILEEYRDDLSDTQKTVLRLLDMPEKIFWKTGKMAT